MALSTYFKPDVEVLQKFQNLNPLINTATLQSVIIGPSYKKIKDFNDALSTGVRLGSYAKTEVTLDLPALPSGSVVLEDTLNVTIKNYAGEHKIKKSVFKLQSNAGALSVSGAVRIVDYNMNYILSNVSASTAPGDNDGDYVHVLYGAAAGYYEIQSVEDQNTLIVDDPDGVLASVGSASGLEYTVASFGWSKVDDAIMLSPRLSDNGIVYLSGVARRKDYTEKVVIASSVAEMEEIFGAGEVTLENPLAYGMSKALPSLGANEVILGIMVEDDTPLSYQKAFEMLETEEVYCMVPLTTNPIVHQILKEHVVTMSDVTQKRERIGLFNTARQTRVTKSGYLGRQNKLTGVWDMADGNIAPSGTELSVISLFNHETLLSDGSGVAQEELIGSGYDRLVVYYRPKVDFSFSYSVLSNPGVDIAVPLSQFTSDGVCTIKLVGDSFEGVKFTSTASHAENCEVYYAQSSNLPAGAELFYPYLVNGAVQADNPFIVPTAGHFAMQLRVYDKTNPTADPMSGVLPGGMTIRAFYGNGSSRDITTAGTHIFSQQIVRLYTFNSAAVSNADDYLIEAMVLVNAGTYAINRFVDEEATFLSDGVVDGQDELVLIDKSVIDYGTVSGYKESKYLVKTVVSETELIINKIWNDELEDFELGQFDAIVDDNFYRVQTPVITNKYVMARWYRDISKSFAERRMTHIFAPAVGVSNDGVNVTPVPGYYFACAYAGATQSDAPQKGFTNRSFAGFIKVFFTNDYFTEAQMDIIAEGGTTIVVQPGQRSALTVRHQLTTDMTTVETREYSVTKNVDHMAKTARATFRPYIGRYLINDETLNLLYKAGAALVERWLKLGQVLPGSAVDRFQVDPAQIDRVFACFKLKVPIPLNYIRLIFII